ncbi:retrovirus-related pol polyprotein from transposon TNT 1-94 [Tanacetum coccineum]
MGILSGRSTGARCSPKPAPIPVGDLIGAPLRAQCSIKYTLFSDKWHEKGPLSSIISRRHMYNAKIDSNVKVADMISNGQWKWPNEWISLFLVLKEMRIPNINDDVQDRVMWLTEKNKLVNFSTSRVWHDVNEHGTKVDWYDVIWYPNCIPRHAFILWLLVQERLPTQDRLCKWYPNRVMKCALCSQEQDSHQHLIFKCNIQDQFRVKQVVVKKIVFAATIYFLWQERNLRLFQDAKRKWEDLWQVIEENVKIKLSCLRSNVRELSEKIPNGTEVLPNLGDASYNNLYGSGCEHRARALISPMELKDDSGTNPCCILWKAKYAKLQQKNTRAEEGRSALKQALAVFESEYDKMKKDYEKEKLRVDNERMAKEKESAVRVSLENEISSLKSEVLSLSQKGSSVPENVSEELKLLQGRVSEKEKELKCLQEEKRRANEACESSKAEKNRVDQELSKLKAQLLKVETETKQLKKDLQKEKARADSEKKRADEVLKTAKTEQAELDVLKAVKNNINDLSSKSEDKSLETEIGRLKELLDKEKKRADIETKKAETEKKSANRLKEMLKSEQSRAIEQTKLVDVERKKAEEFAHQLQKLKCEADEAKSKLVSEGSKFKDANNKKIEAERKKTIKEKKKAEEQQKIAEMSTKHALEEKQRADMFKQQAMSEKARADKLAKELEDTKQRTKKASAELTNPSVVLVQKDLEAKSAEMKLLKKRLKLEKERVKHADKVAELEKKCKKVVEEELHQLKLEFARFSSRIGLCNCFSVGKSCLEKVGFEYFFRR